jgi:hypothetical protein
MYVAAPTLLLRSNNASDVYVYIFTSSVFSLVTSCVVFFDEGFMLAGIHLSCVVLGTWDLDVTVA